MIFRHALSLILFVSTQMAFADQNRCLPSSSSDQRLYRSDSRTATSLKNAETNFKEIYDSGKRMGKRAYWDQDQKSFVLPTANGNAKIDPRFIHNLTRQMEIALEHGYANFLFYSDMGHVHLIAPTKAIAELNKITSPKERLEKIFALKELKFLYHTGELFEFKEGDPISGPLKQDLWLQWRYFSRNFLGVNSDGENVSVLFSNSPVYNTVRELPGYQQLEVLYMSSSHDGCFAYTSKEQSLFFDFSFEFLQQAPKN